MRWRRSCIGSVIGVVLLALAGVIGTDTGLAAMSSLRPTLGVRGASVPAVLNAVQLVGWGSFEVIVMRDSADALAKQAFGLSMPLIWTMVFGLLATLLAISGPLSFVRRFLRTWGIWLLLAGAAWLSWNLLAKHDLAALMRRPGTGDMSFGGAIDLVVAMPLSWLPLIADYTRFGRRAGETFRGTLLGYGIANIWFYALGAIYGLAAGGGDALLTGALAQAGGGFALLLILIDEVDNAFADIHSAAVSTGTFWTRGNGAAAVGGIRCTVHGDRPARADGEVSELPAADRLRVRAAVRRGAGGSLHRAQAPDRSRRARRPAAAVTASRAAGI